MASPGVLSVSKVVQLLKASEGLSSATAEVAASQEAPWLTPIDLTHMLTGNVATELMEKGSGGRYPAVCVYCSRLSNRMREKFRTFSGVAQLVLEVRVSQDRVDGLERQMQLYVDSLCRVLDRNRGDWGGGMFYAGGYEVTFGPIRHGGRNYLQSAKVELEVDVSI